MLRKLFSKSRSRMTPHNLYGGVMAQARLPELYAGFGVPDTVMGRFDMLALHTWLLNRRLVRTDVSGSDDLNQAVFDLFVADVERALRQLGVGDTTVPKRKKKMVRSYYGQIEDFEALLDNADVDGLAEAVGQRYLQDSESGDAMGLARYMLAMASGLEKQGDAELMSGKLEWPEVKAG